MNPITLLMIVLTATPILFGFLLGLLRGSRRATLRLVLIIVSVALAVALCGLFAGKLVNMEVEADGTTTTMAEYIKTTLVENLPESMAEAISGMAISMIQSFLKVIIFLMLFGIFWFLTWAIAYPLCKLFVKKPQRKHTLLGGIIGIVQGAIVALVVCIVFNGLIVQAGKVVTIADDFSDSQQQTQALARSDDGEDNVDYDADEGYTNDETASDYTAVISEYIESPICNVYNKIGTKPFDWLSRVKLDDEEGTTVTLSGQIDAIKGLANMAKELMGLQDLDFYNLLQEGNIEAITDLFNRLDAIKNSLSDESKATLNKLFNAVADDIGIDLGDIVITDIEFQKEGQIFANLYQYNNNEEISSEEAKDIIKNIADSDIILEVLKSQDGVDLGSQLEKEHRDAIVEEINELEQSGNYSQDKIDALRKLFDTANNAQ